MLHAYLLYVISTTLVKQLVWQELKSKAYVTYNLPSSNPPNPQALPTVSTTKDLWIFTRLSADVNVVSAANKARGMLFYLKRSFAAIPSAHIDPRKNSHPNDRSHIPTPTTFIVVFTAP